MLEVIPVIVERLIKVPFKDFVSQNILVPLSMNSTSWGLEGDVATGFWHDHHLDGSTGEMIPVGPQVCDSGGQAAFEILSNTRDLVG